MVRTALVAFAVALIASPPAAAGCKPAEGRSAQLITVRVPRATMTYGALRLWRRSGSCWIPVAGPWRAHVGRSGVSAHHLEGDGTTPIGTFSIGPVIYGIAPDPGVHYAYHRVVCGDWWDEDPASATYNRFRHVRCGKRPAFAGGSEGLWTQTRAYQHFAVIQYNADRVVPGRGSAIFLHDDTGGPTNGCVSLPPLELNDVLRWLDPASAPLIVIATDAAARRS